MNIIIMFIIIMFIILQIYILLICVNAYNNIWIIRHCDKLNDIDKCCSPIGDNRSRLWGNFFTNYYSDSKVNINIYATGSLYDFFCEENKNIRGPINKKCNKSQRMVLTANYIYNNLTYNNLKYDKYTYYSVNPKINTLFCAEDEKILINC